MGHKREEGFITQDDQDDQYCRLLFTAFTQERDVVQQDFLL